MLFLNKIVSQITNVGSLSNNPWQVMVPTVFQLYVNIFFAHCASIIVKWITRDLRSNPPTLAVNAFYSQYVQRKDNFFSTPGWFQSDNEITIIDLDLHDVIHCAWIFGTYCCDNFSALCGELVQVFEKRNSLNKSCNALKRMRFVAVFLKVCEV